MSEIRIVHQQQQQLQSNTVVPSQAADQFVENLRVGQTLNAKLVLIENKHWLVVEGVKIFIPKETVQQWDLQENKTIKLKVRSLAEPVELQIINNKPVNREQLKPASPLQVPSDIAQTVKNDSNRSIQPTTKEPINNQPLLKQEVTTSDNKIITSSIDTEKIILEARKYLNKTVPSQSVFDGDSKVVTVNNESDRIASIVHKKLLIPGSTQIKNHPEINKPAAVTSTPAKPADTAVSYVNNSLNPQKSAMNQVTLNTDLPLNKISLDMQKALNNQQTTVVKDTNKNKSATAVIAKADTSKTAPVKTHPVQIGPTKIEISTTVPSTNISSDYVKKIINPDSLIQVNKQNKLAQLQLNNTSASGNKVQQSISEQAVKVQTHSIKPELTAINQNNLTNQHNSAKKVKFEIPVSLPDKERFPMLSEKMTAAFDRHLQLQQPTKKEFNALFSQLQRLNQWSADNKTSRRSEAGSQSEKLASDLKESLKDLFRYINHKDSLKSAKSVEKALRQSGAFLENRINRQETAEKKQLTKSSTELTIHKDLKANLNRVLATALYNLAKINNPQSSSATTTKTDAQATATSTTEQKLTAAHRQVGEPAVIEKSNLLANLRSRLMKITQGQPTTTNLPELEAITRRVLKSANSVLSQTQMSQLTNLRPDTSAQQWLFELPVMNKDHLDVFTLFLKQHANKDDEKSKQGDWSLVLQFDIGRLGKIRAMLSWNTEKVKVKFIAEQAETVSVVHNELEQFQNKLNELGIAFEQLTVEQAQLDNLTIQFSKGAANG